MKIKYKFKQQKATPDGGLILIHEMMKRIGFARQIKDIFGHYRRVRRFEPYKNIQLMIASILSGGEKLYDIERYHNDPVVCGLFGNGQVPEDTTLRDDLKHIGNQDEARQEMLFRSNEELFKQENRKSITIDIDATALPVDGHQEGAEFGYCPSEPNSRCFQNLSAICDETKTTIAEETRPGNHHCSFDIIPFVKRILNRFSPQMERIIIRMDKGFFSHKLLEAIEEYENVIYEVAVPQHEPIQDIVHNLDYKPYHKSIREYSCFQRLDEPVDRVYYVERTLKPQPPQLELIGSYCYSYRVMVTNDVDRQPHTLFQDYNGRGRDEQQIGELKNEYAMGKMISGDFEVTRALVWVSHLAYTLVGIFKRLVLRGEVCRMGLRRLRFLLFDCVATLTHHSREWALSFIPPRLGEVRFRYYLRRVWAIR